MDSQSGKVLFRTKEVLFSDNRTIMASQHRFASTSARLDESNGSQAKLQRSKINETPRFPSGGSSDVAKGLHSDWVPRNGYFTHKHGHIVARPGRKKI